MNEPGASAASPLGAFRAAVAFLTRVPVGAKPITQRDSAWAPAVFPLIGALVGALTGSVFLCCTRLGPLPAACVAIALSLYITGAFHEDGLTDAADALFCSTSRERALEIMKDSRIGSYGAAVLVLALVARITLVAQCAAVALCALTWAGCIARLGAVCLMVSLPHASPATSKHKDLLSTRRLSPIYAGLLACGVAGVIVYVVPSASLRLLLAGLAVALVTLWFARMAKRRLGGVTGDLLGACEQIGEIAVLLVFAWRA